MIKVIVSLFLVGMALGQHYEHHHHKVVDYHAPAHYKFEYSVHDPHTHDIKKQEEERKDDKVKGFYSLHEADGTVREVHYTSDKHNGFNAVVHRSGHAQHPQKYGHSDERYHSHHHHNDHPDNHHEEKHHEEKHHKSSGGASSSYSFTGHY